MSLSRVEYLLSGFIDTRHCHVVRYICSTDWRGFGIEFRSTAAKRAGIISTLPTNWRASRISATIKLTRLLILGGLEDSIWTKVIWVYHIMDSVPLIFDALRVVQLLMTAIWSGRLNKNFLVHETCRRVDKIALTWNLSCWRLAYLAVWGATTSCILLVPVAWSVQGSTLILGLIVLTLALKLTLPLGAHLLPSRHLFFPRSLRLLLFSYFCRQWVKDRVWE